MSDSLMRGKFLAIVFLLSMTSSCSRAQTSERAGRVDVSPDGKWIVYKWEERRIAAVGPEWATLSQVVSVCLASTKTPAQTKMIGVGKWGMDKNGYSLSDNTFFAFSPEGKRLAVVSPLGLLFISCETGESRTCKLPQGYVSSVSWLDSNRVVYVQRVPQDEYVAERSVWRQRWDQPADQRQLVYRDLGSHIGMHPVSQREFWSPNGGYLLFQTGEERNNERVALLNASDGMITVVEENACCVCASWERSASYVFWLSSARGAESLRAHLYDVSGRKHLDLTREWRDTFGTASSYSAPDLDRLWTPDNQFVVGRDSNNGGFLIRPRGWEVRLLGKALAGSSSHPPAVRSQAAAGILMADLHPNDAVIDYEGSIIDQLGNGGYSGWTVFPDGTQAVSIHPGNSVVVVPLE